jgi:hypothetical protein
LFKEHRLAGAVGHRQVEVEAFARRVAALPRSSAKPATAG